MRALSTLFVLSLVACTSSVAQRAPQAHAQRDPAPGPTRSVILPSPGNPLAAIRLVFEVGSVDDPHGKEGLAALTAAMLAEAGSVDRGYAELLDSLYPMAAAIHLNVDKEVTVLHGTVHRDNLEAYADLLASQVVTPAFASEDFRRNKQAAKDYLAKTLRGNNDEELGKQALAAAMFAGHPYEYPAQGTVAGLEAIHLDDVKAFYQRFYARSRLIVGVAGGFAESFAKGFVARFDKLPATAPKREALPPAQEVKGLNVVILDKQNRATAISMGHPLAVTRADDDFYPLYLAASYLGEHRTFNGVLMQKMRGERGLNYGDYAYVENFIQDGWSTFPIPNAPRRQGKFEIWIRPVAPRNALFSLRHALYETQKLVNEGIPQPGFEETRDFLLNYSKLWTQNGSRRLGYAIDAVLYGKDLVSELAARLPKMTKADVDQALRKYIDPNNLSVAMVAANGDDLRAALLSGAPSPIVYDTQGTPENILSEDLVIQELDLEARGAYTKVMPVQSAFEH